MELKECHQENYNSINTQKMSSMLDIRNSETFAYKYIVCSLIKYLFWALKLTLINLKFNNQPFQSDNSYIPVNKGNLD